MNGRLARGLAGALALLGAAACSRPAPLPTPLADAAPQSRGAADASPSADAPNAPLRVEAAGEPFFVHRFSFDTGRTAFELRDLAMHGSLTEALGEAGRVAVNGGFFDPDGRPLGLAVSGGKALSRFSPTMSGGVFAVAGGVARVVATEEYDAKGAVEFAVQCRPRLVVGGRANVRSDDGQRAERTALCVRDGGKAVDVVVALPAPGTRGPSLMALGRYLAETVGCDDALNLDGGPSTGVAFRLEDAGLSTPKVVPPRGPLRHAIVLR